MILKIKLGAGWRGLDSYVTSKPGAVMLASNLGGKTPRDRAREIAGLRSARPDLKKAAVGHLVLSHDPALPDLTPDEWRRAIDIAREQHDLRDAPYFAVSHNDVDHRHVHLAFLRVRPDGSVVSDSHSYRKNEAAAREIERQLGLPPPRSVAAEKAPGDRQRTDNATRRSRRKHQQQQEQKQETIMDLNDLRCRIVKALGDADSTPTFNQKLLALEVEAEWSANLAGVKFKPIGSTTWLKGSSVHRDLSAARITATLERNAELRREAGQAAEAAAASAADRAEHRVAGHIERHGGEIKIAPEAAPARALTPAAAQIEQQRLNDLEAIATDPLAFLQPPPPVRPVGVPHDDAALGAPSVEHHRAEREAAEHELDLQLRRMEVGQLYDLKSYEISPLLLTAEQLTALVNLMLKIMSLGLVKRSNVFAEARAAQENLADRAEQELARRKRTPASVAEKVKALGVEEKALATRKLQLSARTSIYTQSPARASARALVERRHDAAAAARTGAPTIAARREALAAVAESVRVQAAEITEAELAARAAPGAGRGSLTGLMQSMSSNSKAARARLAALREQQVRDEQRRERAALALEMMLDAFERDFAAEIEAEQERIEAERKATRQEIERLELELRTRMPEERRALERGQLVDQLRHVGAEEAGSSAPDTEVEVAIRDRDSRG
ncbi:MAG: relaxase/mobilization nuclease domain-containing protein [Pseudomonadota bacterium]